MMKKIIVATKNQGKIKEMINAFKNLPVELHSLSEFGPLPDAVEDGTTFEENAIKNPRYSDGTLEYIIEESSSSSLS